MLVALNTRTYGGSDNPIWDKSKPGGVRGSKEKFGPRSPYDKKLEWMTFTKTGLTNEQIKCLSGNAKKVH